MPDGTHAHTLSTTPTESAYIIRGGTPVAGVVSASGAKNAITKQLVASLLTSEPCVLGNVPRIAEIDAVLNMLAEVGCRYEWIDRETLRVRTSSVQTGNVGSRYSGVNRIPILMLAPLLHRIGEARVPTVGGCNIGPRPVNFHLDALARLGADVDTTMDGYRATANGLSGAEITLPYPSVGATETCVFAAVLARGTTVIDNAAIEPEIVDTIAFLQKMGARISIGVGRRIVVEGVARLHGANHTTLSDRIEAASFAVAAVTTGGEVTVNNARHEDLATFLTVLRAAGGGFRAERNGITFFRRNDELSPVHIETDVHPGFMTDWQQPMAVLLTQAEGVSIVHETVYENRFGYTSALQRMGAAVSLTDFCLGSAACRFAKQGHTHSCLIHGSTPLTGRPIAIPDLRAGFAYVIAALAAHGTTQLTGIKYLERGYADVLQKLQAVGADVELDSGDSTTRTFAA